MPSYERFAGYESTIPDDPNQRIQHALELTSYGGKIILGVSMLHGAEHGTRQTLQSEIIMQQRVGKLSGGYVIGPNVMFKTADGLPFAPYGLAVWDLSDNQA